MSISIETLALAKKCLKIDGIEIDKIEFITIDDIDEICGQSLDVINESEMSL